MSKPVSDELDLHRPPARHGGGPRLGNVALVKQQLLQEIIELQRQLDTAAENGKIDFSLIQTLREMIQSRRALFNRLERGITES
jgi:carbamate kinase